MTKADKKRLMDKCLLHLEQCVELSVKFKPNPFNANLYNAMRVLAAAVEELVNDLPDD